VHAYVVVSGEKEDLKNETRRTKAIGIEEEANAKAGTEMK